jgi:hypothetical protein
MIPTTQCNCCFTDYLVKCSTEINVYAKLTPSTAYEWVITDKFNRQYSGSFTTDAEGFWSIPVASLPDGLLTEFSGRFSLQVFEDGTTCAPIKFLIATETDCIDFTVSAGTREKNNLGCEF